VSSIKERVASYAVEVVWCPLYRAFSAHRHENLNRICTPAYSCLEAMEYNQVVNDVEVASLCTWHFEDVAESDN